MTAAMHPRQGLGEQQDGILECNGNQGVELARGGICATFMAQGVRGVVVPGNMGPRGFEQREVLMAEAQQAAEAQQTFFRITDNIPEETWYWAAVGSIGISALLKLANKDDWAIFVGQWPPTFLLFGLYHRLVRPSRR